jgi:16S rRNA (cytosine967-C5)-methyltransferase
MNKTLQYSIIILNNVVEKNIPFSVAIKNLAVNKKLDRIIRNDVSSLCGAALRHFYVLDSLISKHITNINSECKFALMIYLSNRLFVNRVNNEEAAIDVRGLLLDHEIIFDLRNFDNVELNNLISEDIDKKSLEFLSLRFNVPLQLIKMWKKHYGEALTYRILIGLNRKETTYALINSYVTPKEQFLAKYNDFSSVDETNLVLYTGKDPLKRTKAYVENNVFPIKSAENYMLSLLDLDETRGIAIYSGGYNTMHLAVMSLFSHLSKFEIIAPRSSSYYEIRKDLEKFDLKHVSLYEGEAKTLLTCISNKVHTFIVYPRNSGFALLRNSPDFFLRCSMDKMDEYINEVKLTLEESSQLVSDDGQLLLVLPTISKKETHIVTVEFLNKHLEYRLVEERQFLPIDKYDSCIYFALFKKVSIDD